ncbi:coiled-coil domain-containing protein 113 isoform X5 [Suricata suricatta]|uniref:coiled-coil domain-containing protein 113 isoform X5 n=1 Tax=Suricata suricatta TaxID=37032 RepID=UPI0011553B0B|nr:coiled-coil domain-containing protein 113 isoform X5 [Suricata suricatta]
MSDEDSETPATELQGGEENELPIIQLCALVEEVSYGNSALNTETEMFEKYYNKLEPTGQRHPRLSEIKVMGAEFAQLRGRRKSKFRTDMDRGLGLSCDQKCEIILKELEDTKDEMRHMRANAERNLQHHEDSMKDKLRLKNVSLKAQRKKMLLQLRQKEEVGEALRDVDFQQLKIKNAQFLETAEAKNQELVQLKLECGNTLQILNTYKSKLQRAVDMSIHLDKEILLRKELLEKIERETLQVEEDRAKAEAANKRLCRQLAEFRAPPVILYVREKIVTGDLEKTIKMWERKVEIAEMSLKGYRKAWNKMKTTNEHLQAICPPGK